MPPSSNQSLNLYSSTPNKLLTLPFALTFTLTLLLLLLPQQTYTKSIEVPKITLQTPLDIKLGRL